MSEQPERPEGYHPDQLLQGNYPPYDRVIHGPPGTDVGSLWIEMNVDADNKVVTCSSWNLDDRQRAMILHGAHIRLSMWEYPICPVSVAVEAPFCDCHGEEMLYDEDDSMFLCRHMRNVGDSHDDEHNASRDAEEQLRRDFSPGEEEEPPEGSDLD